MSAYINLVTYEYPRHEGDIRLKYPKMGDVFKCPPDFALVQPVERPTFDFKTQRCYEGAPEFRDGGWWMTWVVRDATPAEIEAALNPPKLPHERFL